MKKETMSSEFDVTSRFKEIVGECVELFEAKNAEYGSAFLDGGLVGSFIRIQEKINRAINLKKSSVTITTDETLNDTLRDIANISIMAMIINDYQKDEAMPIPAIMMDPNKEKLDLNDVAQVISYIGFLQSKVNELEKDTDDYDDQYDHYADEAYRDSQDLKNRGRYKTNF